MLPQLPMREPKNSMFTVFFLSNHMYVGAVWWVHARPLKIWGFRLVWSYTCMAECLKKVPDSSQMNDMCSHFLQTPTTSHDTEGVVHTLLEEVIRHSSLSLSLLLALIEILSSKPDLGF